MEELNLWRRYKRYRATAAVLLIAILFALFRSSTGLVWEDSPNLAANLYFKSSPLNLDTHNLVEYILAQSFSSLSLSGYRPLSTAIAMLGTAYFSSGKSLFLWSLFPGVLIGLTGYVYYRLALYFVESRALSIVAVCLFILSAPFIAASWIVFSGIQTIVPLIIGTVLLVYFSYFDRKLDAIGGVLIVFLLFIGPLFREYTGLGALLIVMFELLRKDKRLAWIVLGCLGLVHAIFPGAILSLFIHGAPHNSIFSMGTLGIQMQKQDVGIEGAHSLLSAIYNKAKFYVLYHMWAQLPSTAWITLIISTLIYTGMVVGNFRVFFTSKNKLLMLLVWAMLSFIPFLWVYAEDVHLLYVLMPLSILVSYMVKLIYDALSRAMLLKVLIFLLLLTAVVSNIFNLIGSYKIVNDINKGDAQVAREIEKAVPKGSIIVSNALSLEDLLLFSNHWFESYWSVSAGIPHPNSYIASERDLSELVKKAQNLGKKVYLLDISQPFLPEKLDYHSMRFVNNGRLNLGQKIPLHTTSVKYPFVDPLQNFLPRRYTTVLFAPDLENDFYHGAAFDGSYFIRQVYAQYDLYEVRSPKVFPKIKVTASSALNSQLTAKDLIYSKNPGWHSERDPRYPQTLTISLNENRLIKSVGFMQQDGYKKRMPNSIVMEASVNGIKWQVIQKVSSICDIDPDVSGWRYINLKSPLEAKYIRIKILSNCGDRELLTLRGLRFR
ncbi:MAG: discoidin domain-containing protein [Gammaproteobacteria bacterium]|nr:discoidin domain-containing protein [Gammaproteobacteria bacterium]